MNRELAEHEDYYFDEKGNMVFTAKYLLDRRTCCGSGCRHCPYHYVNVPQPGVAKERPQKFLINP